MDDQQRPGGRFETLLDYFRASRFRYLAFDSDGFSVRFSREPLDAGSTLRGARESARPAVPVLAPSLGFVEPPPGRARFPEAGEATAKGDCLFVIRRFKHVVEVRATAGGSLGAVMVERGAFVEFGQPLATIV